MNPSYTAFELHHQLADSAAVAVICPAEHEAKVRDAIEGTAVAHVGLLENLGGDDGWAPTVAVDPNMTAALPYSSGTTGLPKGVMLSHANLIAQLEALAEADPFAADDVGLAVLPFFHIYGMQVVMNAALAQGGCVVTLRRFDLETVLRVVTDYRVTRFYAVPPMLAAVAKHPDLSAHDLSSLRLVLTGAAPMSPDLLEVIAGRLDCRVLQAFGMTELAGASHISGTVASGPGGCGTPVPGIECRIVDEAGHDLPPGELGELWIRGAQVMQGYWRNPSATAATLVDGGWLRTGDLARIDAAGNLTVVDRLKELIKCNGFQVAPAELEGVLAAHEAVADAAVIGVPDEQCGEVPAAFVVLKAGHEIDAAALREFTNARLARYKHVRRLEFVATVPRTPAGKVVRRALRESVTTAD
jgi:4-coumarate--CoA ligase